MEHQEKGLFSLIDFGRQATIEGRIEDFFVNLYEIAEEHMSSLKSFQHLLDEIFYGKEGTR